MKRFEKTMLCLLLVCICAASLLPVSASAAFSRPQLSPQNLSVDYEDIRCEKYNIDGNNYFKLRDLAYVLNGTGSQFSVDWDAATATVSIWTGKAYTPNGSELAVGADRSSTAVRSSQSILINGVLRDDLSVYNIGGNNYFKLRDLGQALNFDVSYDADTNTAIVRSDLAYSWYAEDICYAYSADDLMRSIRDGATIYLAPGTYNLTQWLENIYNENGGNYTMIHKTYPHLSTDNMRYDDEVLLERVSGLRLIGAGAGVTEIVVEPRYANVLVFDNCLTFSIRGITFGHTPDQGYCSGAVLNFRNCDEVTLSGLDLYGCGTYGIEASNLTYAEVKDTVIRDCSYGAMSIRNSYAIDFYRCDIRNNRDLDTLDFYCTGGLWFEDCAFTGNEFDFVDGCGFFCCNEDAQDMFPDVASFINCTFGQAEYESLVNSGMIDRLITLSGARIVS